MLRLQGHNRIAPIKDLSSLIPVTEASRISGLTAALIRLRLKQGKIDGIKLGRDWFTTREAVRAYLKQDRRPGPKPKK